MKVRLTEAIVRDAACPADKSVVTLTDDVVPGLFVRVTRAGARTFYVRYFNGHKDQQMKLGRWSRVYTLKRARREALDLVRSGDPVAARQQKKRAGDETLKKFLDDYYRERMASRRSGKQIIDAIENHFEAWLDRPLSFITRTRLERWQWRARKRGLKPASINRPQSYLKTCLKRAVHLGWLDRNPFDDFLDGGWRHPEPEAHRIRVLTDIEEKRLRKALRRAPKWLGAMITLSLKTGLRKGEIFTLTWANVDLINGYLTIVAENAKSNRTRRVPLNREARQLLVDWRKEHDGDYVFENPSTGLPFDNFKRSWTTARKRAELKDLTFHDLRHTACSRMFLSGADALRVMKIMGHSELKTTLRYAHVSDEELRAAVEGI